MKANEYIRKYGWICAGMKIAEIEHSKDFDGFYLDLKRLVESYELVEKLGGLDGAKIYVPDSYKSERLKEAIADVESCQ